MPKNIHGRNRVQYFLLFKASNLRHTVNKWSNSELMLHLKTPKCKGTNT